MTELAEWFTVAQAAEELRLSKSTVHKQITAGAITATRVGNGLLVHRDELERYRAQSLGKPGRKKP